MASQDTYPPITLCSCPKEGCSGVLSALKVCKGEGKYIENINRRFKVCAICREFVWFDPPTPLSQIDPQVVGRIARKQENLLTPGPIPCSSPHCMTASGARRDANKLCECNDPGPLCRPCCLIRGGCRQHRPPPGSIHQIESQGSTVTAVGTLPVALPTREALVASPVASTGVSLSLQQILSQAMAAQALQMHIASQTEAKATSQNVPKRLSSGGQPPSSQSNQATTGNKYAQALDNDYGRQAASSRLQSHANRQAKVMRYEYERKIMERRRNTQIVQVWNESNEPPRRLRLILPIYRVLIPEDHPKLVRVLGLSCDSIEVLHIVEGGHSDWLEQGLDVAIDTVPSVTVLIKKADLEYDDCPGIDEAIATVLQEFLNSASYLTENIKAKQRAGSPRPLNKGKLRARSPPLKALSSIPSSDSSTSPTSSPFSGISHASSSTSHAPSVAGPSGLVSFPLEFTCDMVEGFEKMLQISGKRTKEKVEAHFNINWPQCRFVYSTYYKHQKLYLEAKDAKIVDHFVALGYSKEGRWCSLLQALSKLDAYEQDQKPVVADISEPKPSASAPTLSNNDVINVTDSESEGDEYEYDVSEVCIKQFVMENDDILVVENKDMPRPIVIMQRPRYGSKKNIYETLFCWGSDKRQQSYILKKVSLPGKWWLPAPDRATAYLLEAIELMHAHFLMERFDVLARGTESVICSIRFAPTFILYNPRYTLGLGQPALSGIHFTRQSLVDQGNHLAVNTLDAFEHFIFDATRRVKVMTDFQGLVERDGTLCIFNGYMHSETSGFFSLGNRGSIGISTFQKSHICNPICFAMGLGNIDTN